MSFNINQARPYEVEEFDEDNFKEVLKWFRNRHFHELRVHNFKTIYYGASYDESFCDFKEQEIWERWDVLTLYIKLLENAGEKAIKHIEARNPYAFYEKSGKRVIEKMITTVFPNCHEITAKYVLSGYTLELGWEEEIVNYLKDDNVNSLSNENIFILFSTEMPVEEFLELSTLPKNFLAKLLPSKRL